MLEQEKEEKKGRTYLQIRHAVCYQLDRLRVNQEITNEFIAEQITSHLFENVDVLKDIK
jgi:hypothetical protein